MVAEELVALVQTLVVVLMGEGWLLERLAIFVVEVAPKVLLDLSLFVMANALERVAMSLVVVVLVGPKNSLGLSLLTANTVPLLAVLPGERFGDDRFHDDHDNSLEIVVELNRMRMMRMIRIMKER